MGCKQESSNIIEVIQNSVQTRFTNNRYGGVGLLYRPNIKLLPTKDLERQDLEVTWMETRVNRTLLLIASIYIPPEQIYQLDNLMLCLKLSTQV